MGKGSHYLSISCYGDDIISVMPQGIYTHCSVRRGSVIYFEYAMGRRDPICLHSCTVALRFTIAPPEVNQPIKHSIPRSLKIVSYLSVLFVN